MALAIGVLAFLGLEYPGGMGEQIAAAIGSTGLVAALLGGVLGALMVRVGSNRKERDEDEAHTDFSLRFAEARFETFWLHMPDSLFSVEVGEAGELTFAGINPAHERLTGLRAIDIVGKTPEACLTPEVAASVLARYRECLRRGDPFTYEETLDLPSGARHWRTSLVPLRHPISGRIVLILGSARDVTPDRTAHEELSRVNARLSSILASVSDSYLTFDSDFRLTFANAAVLRWAGKDAASVIGNSYRGIVDPGTHTGRTIIRAMERREVVHEEMPSLTKSGRWLKYHLYPSSDGGMAMFFRDVTEVRKAREALNNLSRQMLASQENERRRIASELHDSTIQHIVAASLNLMRLGPPASDADRAACDDIQRSLDEALQELRVFTYLLHPPALHSDGLVATLHTFLDGFGRRAGLDVRVRASPELDTLPDDLQHAVFRVVQEALSNTHRHARATHVKVQARLVRGTLCVRVIDDGRGIGVGQARPCDLEDASVGVGLRGMRARLKQFGGQLRVRSSREGRSGTTLVAVVPMARQARSLIVSPSVDLSTTSQGQPGFSPSRIA